MKKYFPAFAIVFLFASSVLAQTPTPTPTPSPTPHDDTDVVKISTSLIQVDVSVTDSKGKVITDLKQDEMEIYENGEKQKITNFSFISSSRTIIEKPNTADKTAVPIPQFTMRADRVRRTIALVVDDLSLSFESTNPTKRALKKFVDEQMQEGDLVAIIRTGAGIGALQQFTADKNMLYAAIEKVKWNPIGNGGISAFAPIESSDPSITSAEPTEGGEESDVPISTGQSLDDFRSSVFSTGTLGALKYVVTGMAELPGRKSVILFSDGFKLFETDDAGVQESGRVMDFLRELVEVANRSSVVFYTVDARGLVFTGLTAADSITNPSMETLQTAIKGRSDQLLDTQQGLSFLAVETGGFSIKNNNDLSGGVRRILDDQSYYLVAYQPDQDTFDPAKRKFNKLEVKVKRPGLSVRYRSGFFNVVDKAAEKAPTAATSYNQLQTALVSPFAVGGISLKLNTLFGADKTNGMFVRSLLHVDAKDLKFIDDKDGTKKAVFDILAASFGDNGQIVDQLGQSYSLAVKPGGLPKLLADGFVYRFTFPVKKPGGYQYRVAIRDEQGAKIGSASQFIEVPDLKKNRVTVSSIVIESLTEEEWQKMMDPDAGRPKTNPLSDTALRRVKTGTVLRYGYEIYNARLNSAKAPELQARIRVFRDRQLVLDGKLQPFDLRGQTDMLHLKNAGAIAIGKKMVPGDYILQIIVTDSLAKPKDRITSQFVQFEVVE